MLSSFQSLFIPFLFSSLCILTAVNSHPVSRSITPSPYVLPLTRKYGTRAAAFARSRSLRKRDGNGTAKLTPGTDAQQFFAPVTFGNQTFNLVVDTGSSDTWVAKEGFQCIAVEGPAVVDSSKCGFGALYTTSSTLNPIANENFNTSYASGEYASGIAALKDIGIAGITLTQQEVGIVDVTNWRSGDNGGDSGLMGLSAPAFTSVFIGTDPSKDVFNSSDGGGNQINYDPVFTTMVKRNLIDPIFSLALDRGTTGGELAFGGVPNASTTGDFVSAPIKKENGAVEDYQVIVDSFVYGEGGDTANSKRSFSTEDIPSKRDDGGDSGSSSSIDPTTISNVLALVDSGTNSLSMPDSIVEAMSALYDPAAKLDQDSGDYLVSCTATPPSIGVKIAGQTFWVDAKDMIIQDPDDNGNCPLGIDGSGDDKSATLGDTFLTNVVAVFDVGDSPAIKFAARAPY